MQRAEKRLAAIKKKIKYCKSEVNLDQIKMLNSLLLCDGKEEKKQRFGVIFCVLLLFLFVVWLMGKYQTSTEVSGCNGFNHCCFYIK